MAMDGATRPRAVIDSSDSDSDDDIPLAVRKAAIQQPSPSTAAPKIAQASVNGTSPEKRDRLRTGNGAGSAPDALKHAKSEDTKGKPKSVKQSTKKSIEIEKNSRKREFLDEASVLLPAPKVAVAAAAPSRKSVDTEWSDDDSEDDVPLAQRKALVLAKVKPSGKIKSSSAKTATPKKKISAPKKRSSHVVEDTPQRKRARPSDGGKSSGKGDGNGDNGEVRWQTLEHAGVLFPPEYQPHGVKMLYDGVPVDLTPEQEEVATFFAVMKETDYMNKPTFLRNFWEGFQEVLGPNHVIKSLEKCDFTPIYEWHMAERERKKSMSKEEKDTIKREKEEKEAKYKWALVDGRKEQVGNFRVEPPGLFRGRGEHPKMGKIKSRIYPRDITINIGEGVPIPEHPYPGQQWKAIKHDKTVTWLAYWKDPINSKEYKYVFLAATSTWKSESDLLKYEKARKLKDYIGDIRSTYQQNWNSNDRRERQMATALYFIDKLALRAGHEKDEDEADTVGCCTLKCENVECIPPNFIKFDFLGKDSIRYENTVEVEHKVFENVANFKAKGPGTRAKSDTDQLFDEFDAQDLNTRLKDLMEGLSVKVFRTYNASITLDTLLSEDSTVETVEGKKAEYDRANKEVAILCNHQRSVPKGHTAAMEKMQEKLATLQSELGDLMEELKRAKAGKPSKEGRKLSEESVRAKIERKRAQIVKAEITAQNKEELKTVALGTSKINYLDPRITVAWCKRNEVPIEKVFNKSLLSKFLWSMDVQPDFKF
jgi:DNA topoisomerase-1